MQDVLYTPTAAPAGRIPGNRTRILLALIHLLHEASGDDPLVARVFDAARKLTEAGLLGYSFVEETSWSSELWADLDSARANRLIWFHDAEQGHLLPRRVVSLSSKGQSLVRRIVSGLGPQVLAKLRSAAGSHTVYSQGPSRP